jgi:hypothetical protein
LRQVRLIEPTRPTLGRRYRDAMVHMQRAAALLRRPIAQLAPRQPARAVALIQKAMQAVRAQMLHEEPARNRAEAMHDPPVASREPRAPPCRVG